MRFISQRKDSSKAPRWRRAYRQTQYEKSRYGEQALILFIAYMTGLMGRGYKRYARTSGFLFDFAMRTDGCRIAAFSKVIHISARKPPFLLSVDNVY